MFSSDSSTSIRSLLHPTETGSFLIQPDNHPLSSYTPQNSWCSPWCSKNNMDGTDDSTVIYGAKEKKKKLPDKINLLSWEGSFNEDCTSQLLQWNFQMKNQCNDLLRKNGTKYAPYKANVKSFQLLNATDPCRNQKAWKNAFCCILSLRSCRQAGQKGWQGPQ